MTLATLLTDLRADAGFMTNVMAWRTLPARAAQWAPYPPALHPTLRTALANRGIDQLYTHQAQAVDQALAGQHVVVVTPTASGKTLCYNLPVLHRLLQEPEACALYLFPTKALAHDQLAELGAWQATLGNAGAPLRPASYDGDTAANARPQIRRQSRVILSNPDMLHTGILPYHTNWESFFANLRYVVLDELHTYRGVFGSHVANVLRRLQRICAFYGSRPQFICASATIANPQQLAERLIEQPVTLVAENGAPSGEKHIILYNPPLYDPERGLRRSAVLEAQELARRCVQGGLQTILFGRSRLTTELLLSYLREQLASRNPQGFDLQAAIRGYRGGYLPSERRAIESGLRSGAVRAVVATNALELGIDIGGLQAAVLCGYPGTIASVWQQIGRAGRTQEGALAILVATGGVLDQYMIQHADYLFDRSPEHALINPDNLMLLVDQVRCAAFELPFQPGEMFGASAFATDALYLLAEQGALQEHNGRFLWRGESYPARQVSLRSAGSDTVTIQVEENAWTRPTLAPVADEIDFYANADPTPAPSGEPGGSVRVLGQIERASAPLLLYAGAIYFHEGQSYQVAQLDLANNLATVTPTAVDYYTEVTSETEVQVLNAVEARAVHGATVAHGELLVSSQVVGYRRIKRFTHENLGVFPLDYAPQTLETSGYWFQLLPEVQLQLAQQGEWFDSLNDYGPNWQAQRRLVRARDDYRCTQCGAPEERAPGGRQHDVHHLVPFRTFGYVPGVNEHYLLANRLENLVLVCRTCHRRLESGVRTRTGLDGLSYALTNIAPLHLMCDPQDIGVHVVRGANPNPHAAEQDDPSASIPTIYLYERITAGLGFSVRLFELHEQMLDAAQQLVRACPCRQGCPACVGPVLENDLVQLETKQLTLALLKALIA